MYAKGFGPTIVIATVTVAAAGGDIACRMCKLDPDVDALLREHNVYVHAALPAAPVQTFSLLMRIEGDVWLAGVGGNEGVHPGHKPGDLMAFAQQVNRLLSQ